MAAVGDTLRDQGLAVPAVGGGTTFLQAKTANEVLKAQERRIRLQKLKGELVDRARAETLMFRLARDERDVWVTWPARVAALMAAELTAALLERGTRHSVQDSEDVLRIRLYQARAALLDSRSAHLAHAERVMNEATEHSTFEFLSGNTLDTILAAGQHVEKRRPGGATAHAPGRLRRPLQAPGCATHTARAAETQGPVAGCGAAVRPGRSSPTGRQRYLR